MSIRLFIISITFFYSICLFSQDNLQVIDSLKKSIKVQSGIPRARSLLQLANHLSYLSEEASAIDLNQEALKIFTDNNHSKGERIALGNICTNYERIGNLEKSLKFTNILISKSKAANDYESLANALNNKATIQNQKNQLDSAIQTCLLASEFAEKSNDKLSITASINNLAYLQSLKGDYSGSYSSYQKALKLSEDLNNTWGSALLLHNIGESLFSMKRYKNAIDTVKKSFALAVKEDYLDLQLTAAGTIANIYEELGNLDSAIHYLKKASILKDSISTKLNSERAQSMEIRNAIKEKEYENQIIIREKELEIKEQKAVAENARQRSFILILVIVFITLISILAILYIKLKNQKKKNLIEVCTKQKELRTIVVTQENERARVARDLHDGVAQTLISAIYKIDNLLNSKKGFLQKEIGSDLVLEDTLGLLRDAHHEIRTVSHEMMPKAITEDNFDTVVYELIEKMLSGTSIIFYFNSYGENKSFGLNAKISIYRIIQELLGNVIKHAQADEINIQFIYGEKLILIIEDNGVGLVNPVNISGGNAGLINIKTRAELFGGVFSLENGTKKGTIAIIKIPFVNLYV